MNNKKWHVWLPPFLQTTLLLILSLKLKGQSGGDLALQLFGLMFLLLLTMVIGIATFQDTLREKRNFFLGLLLAWILHFLVVKIITL